MNDHQLLNAYVQGDEQAFEVLVEKYIRMVYSVATRQTGDPHLAKDIAQCVFLLLSRKARDLSPKASIPGWLLRTTRFVCLDALKARRRRDINEQNLAMNMDQRHVRSEPNSMESLLDEAIQALRPEEQAGIFARFFEDKNFEEIATMFSITVEAARKRTARCLSKLQSFMSKHGAKISLQDLSGLLMAQPAHETANQALQSAIHVVNGAWKTRLADKNVVELANHAERVFRRRSLTKLGLKIALPLVLIILGLWTLRERSRSVTDRIERLGKSWGSLDVRVAQHRQFLMRTDPNTPNYQANVQSELDQISRESSRIIRELNLVLTSSQNRAQLAEFFTSELGDTLKLDGSEKATLFKYIENRMAQGPKVNDAMKMLAENAQTETSEIKQMLSPEQQRRFDDIYGPDGVLLFSYAKAVALGKIGA